MSMVAQYLADTRRGYEPDRRMVADRRQQARLMSADHDRRVADRRELEEAQPDA